MAGSLIERSGGKSRSAKAKGRSTLTRDDIVVAGARLLDQAGSDGLSMRALARALDTGPATLYWHVRDRDELLALILDQTAGTIDVPETGPWQERLVALALAIRDALLPRPALVNVLWEASWRLGERTLAVADAMVGLVAESGLDEVEVADAYFALLTYILGFIVAESRVRTNDGYVAEATAGGFPNLARYDPSADPAAMRRRFDYGVRCMTSGFDSEAKVGR